MDCLLSAVERVQELRNQMDGGQPLDPDEAAAAVGMLEMMLEDAGQAPADGLVCAMALMCSRQSNLFLPVARIALKPLVQSGIRHSHEAAILAQRLARALRPIVKLDERAKWWLERDFIIMAVPVQFILDEILEARRVASDGSQSDAWPNSLETFLATLREKPRGDPRAPEVAIVAPSDFSHFTDRRQSQVT